MKKIILTISILCGLTAFAQKNTKQTETSPISFQKEILKQALAYNDANTAFSSLHNIIALEGASSTYKDSLAILYFQARNYSSSHLIAKELLLKKPDNLQLLEIEASSLQNLGAAKEATVAFETLFSKTKNMYHGYQLANLQYTLKRLAEAKESVSKALACEAIDKATLSMPVDKNENQDVPLKAAVYNLQGMIYYDLKENAEAKKSFEESLKIMPEFSIAKNILAYIEKQSTTPEVAPTKSKK